MGQSHLCSNYTETHKPKMIQESSIESSSLHASGSRETPHCHRPGATGVVVGYSDGDRTGNIHQVSSKELVNRRRESV